MLWTLQCLPMAYLNVSEVDALQVQVLHQVVDAIRVLSNLYILSSYEIEGSMRLILFAMWPC
jgi:hypothetical protein